MITVTKNWSRWCGPWSELIRAVETASGALSRWSGYNSAVRLRVEDRDGVTETGSSIEILTARHPGELRNLASVIVTVGPDREQWNEKRREFDERHVREARERAERGEPVEGRQERFPELQRAEVEIRVTKYGTTLNVQGDERTRVEGLAQQLAQDLGRAATNSPGFFDRSWFALVAPTVIVLCGVGGVLVGGWTGLVEPSRGRLAADEVVAWLAGLAIGVLLVAGAWWLFPTIEMFDEGGAGRARRFRGWTTGVIGALVVGIVGSFIYDQLR